MDRSEINIPTHIIHVFNVHEMDKGPWIITVQCSEQSLNEFVKFLNSHPMVHAEVESEDS